MSLLIRHLKRNFLHQRKAKLIITITVFLLILGNISINFEIFHRWYYSYNYQHDKTNLKIDTTMFDLKEQMYLKSECGCNRRMEKIIITKKATTYEISRNNDQNIINILNTDEFESNILTCDLYRSLRRGKGQKVIGLVIYGQNHMFKEALENLIEQSSKLYKDWIIRVYHDNDKLLDVCHFECEHDNIDFCDVSKLPLGIKETWNANYLHGMMWRWLPIGDHFVDYFISRDMDTCLIEREIDAVQQWLKSDKLFHAMRDSPEHYTPILGGLWGFANKRNKTLANRLFNTIIDPMLATIYNRDKLNAKNYDQLFLKDQIWHHATDKAIIHDSYLCDVFGESLPFPTQRKLSNNFVGMPTIGCPAEDTKIDIEQCPEKCRPTSNKDWLYC